MGWGLCISSVFIKIILRRGVCSYRLKWKTQYSIKMKNILFLCIVLAACRYLIYNILCYFYFERRGWMNSRKMGFILLVNMCLGVDGVLLYFLLFKFFGALSGVCVCGGGWYMWSINKLFISPRGDIFTLHTPYTILSSSSPFIFVFTLFLLLRYSTTHMYERRTHILPS